MKDAGWRGSWWGMVYEGADRPSIGVGCWVKDVGWRIVVGGCWMGNAG